MVTPIRATIPARTAPTIKPGIRCHYKYNSFILLHIFNIMLPVSVNAVLCRFLLFSTFMSNSIDYGNIILNKLLNSDLPEGWDVFCISVCYHPKISALIIHQNQCIHQTCKTLNLTSLQP